MAPLDHSRQSAVGLLVAAPAAYHATVNTGGSGGAPPGASKEKGSMQPSEESIEVGLEEPTEELLKRLEDLPAGTKLRLQVPLGAVALRTSEDANKLRDVQLQRQLALTVASPDHALIVRSRIYGFGVEELRPPAPPPPAPGSPEARAQRRGTGPLPALEDLLGPRHPLVTQTPAPPPPPPAPPEQPIYGLQIGARESRDTLLKRLDHLAAGTRMRLQVPVGSVSLRTDDDFARLKEVWERRQVRGSIVTADPQIIEVARNSGFEVEDLRRHKTSTSGLNPALAPALPAAPMAEAPRPAVPVPATPPPPVRETEPTLTAGGEYRVNVDAQDRTPDVLRRLEALPSGAQVRLYVAVDAKVLRTPESYKMLRYVLERLATVTIVSDDPWAVDLAKRSGFQGESATAVPIPESPAAAAPDSPAAAANAAPDPRVTQPVPAEAEPPAAAAPAATAPASDSVDAPPAGSAPTLPPWLPEPVLVDATPSVPLPIWLQDAVPAGEAPAPDPPWLADAGGAVDAAAEGDTPEEYSVELD